MSTEFQNPGRDTCQVNSTIASAWPFGYPDSAKNTADETDKYRIDAGGGCSFRIHDSPSGQLGAALTLTLLTSMRLAP